MPKMSQGQKVRVDIPPRLAYGMEGYPPVVPANKTLTYDIELVRDITKFTIVNDPALTTIFTDYIFFNRYT